MFVEIFNIITQFNVDKIKTLLEIYRNSHQISSSEEVDSQDFIKWLESNFNFNKLRLETGCSTKKILKELIEFICENF